MTRSEIIEAMARAVCVSGGVDPDEVMANDGRRWRYYVPGAEAALAAIEQAGFVCVDKEAVDDLSTRAATWSNNGRKAWVNTPLVELRALESGRLK